MTGSDGFHIPSYGPPAEPAQIRRFSLSIERYIADRFRKGKPLWRPTLCGGGTVESGRGRWALPNRAGAALGNAAPAGPAWSPA